MNKILKYNSIDEYQVDNICLYMYIPMHIAGRWYWLLPKCLWIVDTITPISFKI